MSTDVLVRVVDCSVAKLPTDKVGKRYRIMVIGKVMHYHSAHLPRTLP